MSKVRDTIENERGLPAKGFKNLLKNSQGLINQRAYVSGTATVTTNEYTLDRWRVVALGENLTFSMAENITAFTAPLNGVEQIVEDIDIVTDTYVVSYTGTASLVIEQSSDLVTWATITANADGSYNLTGGLYTKVKFVNGTFSKPQLELGSVATPFEVRPYGLELSLCQRYYIRYDNTNTGDAFNGSAYNSAALYSCISFPVTLRIPPLGNYAGTITVVGNSATAVTNLFSTGIMSKTAMRIRVEATIILGYSYWLRFEASTIITADAEIY